jgi:integrase
LRRRDGTEFRKAGTKATKDAATMARDEAFTDFNRNEGRNANGHTVESWCDHCLNEVFPNTHRGTTIDGYRHWLTTRVYPVIGATRLDDLSVQQLQLFLNRIQEDKDAPSAALRTKTALAACLTRAVEVGLIPSNPARLAKFRNAAKLTVEDEDEEDQPSKRILSEEEQAALIEHARGTTLYVPVVLGLKLGLRLGEALGLQWRHIDFDKGTVRVRQQVQRVKGKGVQVVPPKTPSGNRLLFMSPLVREALCSARNATDAPDSAFICLSEKGTPMTSQLAAPKFKKIADRADLNGKEGLPDVTFHDCRSTLLSYLANHANNGLGVRPSVLMRIAGHSKIDTTMRYYVRARDEDIQTAMAFIA